MNQHLHPGSSPLFTPWADPVSGVVSYVLTERAAPWQQGFYFTSPNITSDGRWIWLYASFPPSPHVLAVVDMAEGTVSVYPETHFEAESPLVDPDTGEVFWAHAGGVFRRGPEPKDDTIEVATVGAEVTGGRDIRRLSTHLTRSADGKLLNLDVWAGNRWQVGAVDIASGTYQPWFESERRFQHSQFHPSEPRRLLMAQDYWYDPDTGEHHHWRNRMWLLDEGEPARPVFPDDDERVQVQFHEWWGAGGDSVCYVDVGWGTGQTDLATGERRTLWPGGTCHSHATRDTALLAGDVHAYPWDPEPCRVSFYDTTTATEIDIVTDVAVPPTRAYAGYHPDPHPQFVLDDTYVAYTTTALGGLDFALVPVASLLDRTRS